MTVVIGTAGHIDHGKTTLLRALTGIDADRLPEERARGMTIDVGYAHLRLEDGTELDFVDVPGHDRLVGNMLVGAGEIDAALLVVAADDGPRAQTLEHLELLDALGVSDGLAAVTKSDAVEPERVELVVDDVRRLLSRTRLAGVEVLPVSSVTGEGLEAVRRAIVRMRDRTWIGEPETSGETHAGVGASNRRGIRVAIDRVFAVRGRGTVVTGTLRGGEVQVGAVLRVVPGESSAVVRVREVQVHGRVVDRAGDGRVALNVAGARVRELRRGVVLTDDAAVTASDRLLVALRPIAHLESGTGSRGRRSLPPDRARVVLHAGTDHVNAVVGRAGRESVDLPGGEATAILRLERSIAIRAGDPIVLRRPSPGEPVAGGRVLDPDPARGVARRRATPDRLVALAEAEPGGDGWAAARLDLDGLSDEPEGIAADVAAEIEAAILAAVSPDGTRRTELLDVGQASLRRLVGPVSRDAAGRLVGRRLDALAAAGRLARDGDRVRPPGTRSSEPSPELVAAMDRLVEQLAVVAPPPLSEAARQVACPAEGIRELERTNRIVRLGDDLAWAFATYRDLADRAVTMASRAPLTPAAYRDATRTSRKYVMAILEDLDRRAILRRTDAGHVPGPRAPRPDALGASSPTGGSVTAESRVG